MTRRVLTVLIATASLAAAAGVADGRGPHGGGKGDGKPFPARLDLPAGWRPEGIAAGRGHTLYVGSMTAGAVFRLDARTGEGGVAVPGVPGRTAIGLKADRRARLWVAGGATGKAYVHDARRGTLVRELQLAPAGVPTFVNDVVLTRGKAYFTDSARAALYVVDRRSYAVSELPLDIPLQGDFNLNGIVAGPGGRRLLAVQSSTGTLWRIDARTGAATAVDLHGYALTNGDGLLLSGRLLYAVQNQDDKIAVVRLAPDLRSGRLVRTITSDDFDVPTTLARLGHRLYAVNARFSTPPTPQTEYWVTRVSR